MSGTRITAVPGANQIVISRRFAAPRELVYRAYTDPDLLVRWWGTDDHVTRVEDCEPRHGGPWRFVSTDHDGHEHVFRGVFHGTPSPAGFVQTFEYDGIPGRVSLDAYTFLDHGGETTVESVSTFQSCADRDRIATTMDSGVHAAARRLAGLLAALSPE